MTNTLLRAGALSCALLASTALTQPAMAQTAQEHRALDANGVDLTHGDFVAPAVPEGSIGSGEAELALIRQGVWVTGGVNSNGHQWDRIWLGQQPAGGGGSTLTVNLGERFEHFSSTGVISPRTGSSLSGGGGSIDYRTADGAVVTFADPAGSTGPVSNFCNGSAGQDYCMLLPAAITSPDGKTLTLNWDIWVRNLPGDSDGDGNPDYDYAARIASISNGFGYEIRFTYASNGSGGTTAAAPSSWYQRTGAAFHNVPASGGTALGSVSYSYPSAGVTEVTDMGGRVWRVTGTVNGISAIRRPGASSDTIAITGTPAAVTSVTRDGVTTNYARSVSGSIATMTVTDALSQTTTVVSDLTIGQVTSVTDPLNRTTGYQYDGYGRLERVTAPEGNYVQYSYDARGNVTETRAVAKSGTGLPDIVTSATYDATCSNPLECNRPNSVTDTRGNVTDYTYDATHGQVLTVTAPAPAGSGDRPEARYSYTALSGIYHLTGVSACAAGAAPSCVGTADETRTVIGYDARGNLTSTEQRDGTGTLSASRAMTYDALGNLLTVDGPLSGSADTIRYRYNAARQIVGVVGPDPDGGGARKHRAMRATYANDLPTSVEQGNVDSQSDGDWANFAAQQRVEQDYDANARPVVQRLMSGSTAYALTQTSYDALGRVQCAAQRMNSAEFASLPSDACTLDTAGSFGPDRIARTTYDAAGQVTKVETGYGVSGVAADEMIATYRANGRVETVTDANGNKTTYVYDGHDRLSQTRMPHPSTPGTSSTTDFEELTYLTATVGGNTVATPLVAGRRLRDGNSFAFAYDALGRLVERDPPELSNVSTDATTAYGYDNLGRLTSAVQASLSLSVTFAYDALGRTTSETGTFGTVAYQYDLAGRRTRLSWPGSALYVDYDRLVTGEVSAIRENGATTGAGVLGSYVYDDLGRRTLLTRGNGATTSWSYDNVSRLTGLSHGLAGTASDVTFAYAYDPAGGIASRTRDNDGYAYTALANANVTNTVNGLNQVTATSGSSLSYDARGNVIAVPAAASPTGSAATYDYYAENGLVHGPGGSAFIPDPLGRLFVSYAPALGATYYLMDGQTIVAELDSGSNVTRRYVHGPGTDEPLVWYEGSGTTTRRYHHADERGSVIAVSDGSAALVGSAPNRYDEYGNFQGTLTGRFGYTGQLWLPEAGLYHYRARAYNPAMGRFMQTDPIGFGGGMNVYAYVGNNPVNFTDPSGLCGPGQVAVLGPATPNGGDENDVVVTGRARFCIDMPTFGGGGGGGVGTEGHPHPEDNDENHVVVTGVRPPPPGDFYPPTARDLFILAGDHGQGRRRPRTPEERRRCAVMSAAYITVVGIGLGHAGDVATSRQRADVLRRMGRYAMIGSRGGWAGALLGGLVGLVVGLIADRHPERNPIRNIVPECQ